MSCVHLPRIFKSWPNKSSKHGVKPNEVQSHKNTGFIEWSISKSTTTKANKPIRKFYILHCYEFTARKTNVKFGYKYTWSRLITNVKQTDKVGSEYFLYFSKQDMCGCTVYHILCRISCIFCVNYTSLSNFVDVRSHSRTSFRLGTVTINCAIMHILTQLFI